MTQSMASEPSSRPHRRILGTVATKTAKTKMVSRTCGVMLLERGTQLRDGERGEGADADLFQVVVRGPNRILATPAPGGKGEEGVVVGWWQRGGGEAGEVCRRGRCEGREGGEGSR